MIRFHEVNGAECDTPSTESCSRTTFNSVPLK